MEWVRIGTIVEVQHKPGGNVSYDETSLRYDG